MYFSLLRRVVWEVAAHGAVAVTAAAGDEDAVGQIRGRAECLLTSAPAGGT
jgi:hypothetical protein